MLGAAVVGIPGLYLEFSRSNEIPGVLPEVILPSTEVETPREDDKDAKSKELEVETVPEIPPKKEVSSEKPSRNELTSGTYRPKMFAQKAECADQAVELGNIPSIQACDEVVSTKMDCGRFFMFSPNHPDWLCRCCAPFGEEDGQSSDAWNVYEAQIPRLKELGSLPPTPAPIDRWRHATKMVSETG